MAEIGKPSAGVAPAPIIFGVHHEHVVKLKVGPSVVVLAALGLWLLRWLVLDLAAVLR